MEQRNGGYYIAGTRVSLDSILYSFRSGDSPETIVRNFPSLTLEKVYGAITFCLAHEEEIDAYIAKGEDEFGRAVPALKVSRPELHGRLERARRELAAKNLTDR